MEVNYDKPQFFRKEFKFKNEKELNDYFNKSLIQGVTSFLNTTRREYAERLHIYFSWMELTKYISYVLLIFVFLSFLIKASLLITLITLISSVLFHIASIIIKNVIDDLQFGISFVMSILEKDDPYLEEERQKLIEKNKTN